VASSCGQDNETSGSMKGREFLVYVGDFAYQDRLCCMELVRLDNNIKEDEMGRTCNTT
jgi:hypothetical protein